MAHQQPELEEERTHLDPHSVTHIWSSRLQSSSSPWPPWPGATAATAMSTTTTTKPPPLPPPLPPRPRLRGDQWSTTSSSRSRGLQGGHCCSSAPRPPAPHTPTSSSPRGGRCRRNGRTRRSGCGSRRRLLPTTAANPAPPSSTTMAAAAWFREPPVRRRRIRLRPGGAHSTVPLRSTRRLQKYSSKVSELCFPCSGFMSQKFYC